MAKGLGNITSEFLSVTPAGRVYFSSEIRNEDTFCEFKREIGKFSTKLCIKSQRINEGLKITEVITTVMIVFHRVTRPVF